MMIEMREHGKWKALDVLLIGIWVILASILPKFRKRYWSSVTTVSVWTGTIYHPRGVTLSASTIRHETHHIHQAKKHGRLRQSLRYTLSPRWRIWYEGEAYHAGGTPHSKVIKLLTGGLYLIPPWWPDDHISALVTAAQREVCTDCQDDHD